LQNKLAEAVTEQIPSTFAETLKIMYIPQVGYLFQVPTKPGMEDTAKNWGMDGWVWSFEDDQCTYFKTDQCRDLDGNIGDLTTIIIDREVEIGRP
jgi:DNA mismatch repair protein MSH5